MNSDATRHDLKISGIWNSEGGVYKDVVINGVGKIYSDIDCMSLDVNGVCKVDGSIKANAVKINGTVTIKGSLIADESKSIEGINTIGINTAGIIEIKGVADVRDNCHTETFRSKGSFSIGGLLNAGEIDIVLYAPCKAKEVGGEKISVKKDKGFSFKRFINAILPGVNLNDGFYAETIEADDIYLEYTRAKIVRGENVKIGPFCEIDLVEYRNSFDKNDRSKVNENKKV